MDNDPVSVNTFIIYTFRLIGQTILRDLLI